MSLANRTVSDALRSWAQLLECPVGYLEGQRVRVLEREHKDEKLLLTFASDSVGLVSLPSADARDYDLEPDELRELIAMTRAELQVGAVLHMREATLVVDDEPASLALLDEETLSAWPQGVGAFVYDPMPAVLDMLRHEVAPLEWQHGGGAHESPHRVGILAGGVLVALASVARPVGKLARIRVVVAPTHRRRGLGRLVLHTLARHVLDQGLLPYCRLALNDIAARALATAVGFVLFARSLTMHAAAIGTGEGVLGEPVPRAV